MKFQNRRGGRIVLKDVKVVKTKSLLKRIHSNIFVSNHCTCPLRAETKLRNFYRSYVIVRDFAFYPSNHQIDNETLDNMDYGTKCHVYLAVYNILLNLRFTSPHPHQMWIAKLMLS